jgi:hypothetical protein
MRGMEEDPQNTSEHSTAKTIGRPRKEFNVRLFIRLCRVQCTLAEIASVLELSEDTIERRCMEVFSKGFAEAWQEYSAGGKTSVRRAQFQMAQKNVVAAIWWGKQHLGQSDRVTLAPGELDAAIEHGIRELARVKAESEESDKQPVM